jgi:hypothetical protein
MRVFFVSCIAAVAIAIAAAFVFDAIQKPVDVAYSTEGVRL